MCGGDLGGTMDYVQEAKELVGNLDNRMGPSVYDTAWVARLGDPDAGGARWPDLLDWLLARQYPDGSWGGEITYYHDRIICTLAAMLALGENGHGRLVEKALRRAEHYLWHHFHLLSRDPFELAGFELIFPTLLGEAQSLGLDVPAHTCGYGEIQTAKLRLIPMELLYSPHISTVYSLEFLGPHGDPERLRDALSANGSLGTSPATTAYYLLLDHSDRRAWRYLEQVRALPEGIITVYPFRTFELTWVLNNLAMSGAPLTSFTDDKLWRELAAQLGPEGVGMDPLFGVPDGDTTSVCCRVLREAGYEVDYRALKRFQDPQGRSFRTWDYERNVSVSTNVHALEALYLLPDYPQRDEMRNRIAVMLLDQRKYNLYWTDKWHASPHYATSHALIALSRMPEYLRSTCYSTVDWLAHTQRSDGSWGFYEKGTAEETAYAMLALLHYSDLVKVDEQVLHKGAAYLASAYQDGEAVRTELWIAKCLFAPYDIIRSAILAALIRYENKFGRPPG